MTKKTRPKSDCSMNLQDRIVSQYTENGSCSKIENCKSCPLSSGKSKSREAGRSAEKKKKNQTRMFFRLGRESMTSDTLRRRKPDAKSSRSDGCKKTTLRTGCASSGLLRTCVAAADKVREANIVATC